MNARHSSGVKISVGPSGVLAVPHGDHAVAAFLGDPGDDRDLDPGILVIAAVGGGAPRGAGQVHGFVPSWPDWRRARWRRPALSMLAAGRDPRAAVDSDAKLRILGSSRAGELCGGLVSGELPSASGGLAPGSRIAGYLIEEQVGPRRHGGGLPRVRSEAEPVGGAEDPGARTCRRRGVPAAVHPGDAGRGIRRSPAHRSRVRRGRGRRGPVHRHAVRQRAGPAHAARRRAQAARGPRRAYRRPGGVRAGRGALPRPDPP